MRDCVTARVRVNDFVRCVKERCVPLRFCPFERAKFRAKVSKQCSSQKTQ